MPDKRGVSNTTKNTAAAHHTAAKGDLTAGPVGRHLVRLTIPMTFGILAIISFQLIDMFYISLLGTEALAAVTFTFPVTFALFSLTLGMSIATSSTLSRLIGAGDMMRVRRIITHVLIMALILGIVLSILGLLFLDPLFRAMGADENMMPMIHDYMLIWFLGSFFINTPVVGNAILRSSGDAVFPATLMTVAAIANAILDPLLIFGKFGFPEMGMQGAAIATVASNACALAVSLYVIVWRKKMATRTHFTRHIRLFGDSVKRIVFIALPVGLTGIIQPFVNGIITALLAATGPHAVAAFGIATRVEAFVFIIIMALATGMGPILGQNWGAQKFGRVNETLKKAFSFAVSWSVFVALVLVIFAKPIAGIFSSDADVIKNAAFYFTIVPLSYAFGNIVQGWCSAFNAIGFPKRSFIMIATKLIVVNVPLVLIGSHIAGETGIFAAIAATNILCGITFHLWSIRFFVKREKALTDGLVSAA